MNRLLVLIAVCLLGVTAALPEHARADDCAALGGAIVGPECQVDGDVGSKSGTFNLDEPLHILSSGRIAVPAAAGGNALTISICTVPAACDLVMDEGAQILGDAAGTGSASGVGAAITINASRAIVLHGSGGGGAVISSNQAAGSCTPGGVAGRVSLTAQFDIVTEAGSVVSANGTPCPGGAVSLFSALGSVRIDGLVSSSSPFPGIGARQRPGGGFISVIARCNLTVNGTVASTGKDAGADLVHLEGGCDVVINGRVISTGAGHAVPVNPPNHCANVNRPGKPDKSTACVEVWSGGSLTINSTAEINADSGSSGGNAGANWIDLFARGRISILANDVEPFAVHAKGTGGSGGLGEFGGTITVKSTGDTVTISGLALQAIAKSGTNSHGGQIIVESASTADLDGASILARSKSAQLAAGGTISVRSFTAGVSWQNGVGVVQPNATGTIALRACASGGIAVTGTDFKGEVPAMTLDPAPCIGAPTLPDYIASLPACLCTAATGAPCPEDPRRVITRTVDATGTPHGGVPNHLTLGSAVAGASSNEVIGVFSKTIENAVISMKTLVITQCTVAKITAADARLPAVRISSPDRVSIVGLDSVGGTVGWLIESDNHDLKSLRAKQASESGIQVKGNGNSVSWNRVDHNGVGITVDGIGNRLRGGTVDLNARDGVRLTSTATGNVFEGAAVEANGGNGIVVDEIRQHREGQ